MEASIAQTPVSIQTVGRIKDWEEGGTIGAVTGEGGDVYVPW
jgi:hypothetical protein